MYNRNSTANSHHKKQRYSDDNNDDHGRASDNSKQPPFDSNQRVTSTKTSTTNSRQKIDRGQLAEDDEGHGELTINNLHDAQFELSQRVKFIERRLETLENKVDKQTNSFLSFGKKRQANFFELDTNQRGLIGIFVRSTMWKLFKFFDKTCISHQGQQIYNRCLHAAGMTGNEADEAILTSVLASAIKNALGQKRAHVNLAIRDEATGMFLFLICFSASDILTIQISSFSDYKKARGV